MFHIEIIPCFTWKLLHASHGCHMFHLELINTKYSDWLHVFDDTHSIILYSLRVLHVPKYTRERLIGSWFIIPLRLDDTHNIILYSLRVLHVPKYTRERLICSWFVIPLRLECKRMLQITAKVECIVQRLPDIPWPYNLSADSPPESLSGTMSLWNQETLFVSLSVLMGSIVVCTTEILHSLMCLLFMNVSIQHHVGLY